MQDRPRVWDAMEGQAARDKEDDDEHPADIILFGRKFMSSNLKRLPPAPKKEKGESRKNIICFKRRGILGAIMVASPPHLLCPG